MALTMMKENELLQKEIKKLQEKLCSLVTGPQTLQPDINQVNEDTTVMVCPQILRQKCKQLRSQIDVLEGSKYQVLPHDESIQYEILKNDFNTRISQTKECLKFQEHQRKEMHGNIEREKKINDELSSVVSAAGSKYREIQTDKTSKKLVCERLQSKCSQLEKINSELRKETSNFISKNFPLPEKQLFNSVKKKMEITDDSIKLMNYGSLLSLTEIVELLMNANADSPNDPYVVLDHRFWPPYVELLLECDIVVRHPADTRRIKLLPFHL